MANDIGVSTKRRNRRLSHTTARSHRSHRTVKELARQRTRAQAFRESYDPQNWHTYLFAVHATVIPQIFWRLLFFMGWSAVVVACHKYYYEFPQVTTLPHTLAGSALALLIVFRTNQAHSRFWEGRDLFGALFANCVDAARQALLWVGGNSVHRSRMAHLLTAYPYAVMNHVRGNEDTSEIEALWDDASFHELMDAEDLPNVLIMAVSHELVSARKQGLMLDAAATRLDSTLSELLRLRAAIEKISFTPIPHAYAIEGSRMILFFLSSLPIVIVPSLGWFTVLVCTLITFEYLGIEEIGAEIEDPFGFDFNDLPLDRMCENHRYNLIEISEFRARYHAKSRSPLSFQGGIPRSTSTKSAISDGEAGRKLNMTTNLSQSSPFLNTVQAAEEVTDANRGRDSPPKISGGRHVRYNLDESNSNGNLSRGSPLVPTRSNASLAGPSEVAQMALGNDTSDWADPHRVHGNQAPF
eukprot:TRINITY_DN1708_c0_g1_i23.p1 TRINITY_DN1708_c0_g1~~TRINITY_DN1708_c0_g1_i23.p1  ORF type:complete len:469 (-),score=55.32 TRINITY_DN1708_c0_g1_i23:201-1607(-)